MQYFIAFIGILSIFVIIRMVMGPTIWDRMLTFNQLSSKIVISMVFYSILSKQTFILDIALVYTLFSFVATVLIAHFVKERGAF